MLNIRPRPFRHFWEYPDVKSLCYFQNERSGNKYRIIKKYLRRLNGLCFLTAALTILWSTSKEVAISVMSYRYVSMIILEIIKRFVIFTETFPILVFNILVIFRLTFTSQGVLIYIPISIRLTEVRFIDCFISLNLP